MVSCFCRLARSLRPRIAVASRCAGRCLCAALGLTCGLQCVVRGSAVNMQNYFDATCLDANDSPMVHPVRGCDEPREYLVLGKFDSPNIDLSAISAYGGGDFCVVERTTGCQADVDGYEYVRDGECIYVGGANVIMSCTGSRKCLLSA